MELLKNLPYPGPSRFPDHPGATVTVTPTPPTPPAGSSSAWLGSLHTPHIPKSGFLISSTPGFAHQSHRSTDSTNCLLLVQQQTNLSWLSPGRDSEPRKPWAFLPLFSMGKVWSTQVPFLGHRSLCPLLCQGPAVHELLPGCPATQSSTCSWNCSCTLSCLH